MQTTAFEAQTATTATQAANPSSREWWMDWQSHVEPLRVLEIAASVQLWFETLLLRESHVFERLISGKLSLINDAGNVVCIRKSEGWDEETLSTYSDLRVSPPFAVPFYCYMLAVVETFQYGTSWLAEILRTAGIFAKSPSAGREDDLYGKIEVSTEGNPDAHTCDGGIGGIYSNQAPMHGSRVVLRIEGKRVAATYDGGHYGAASKVKGRVMAGVGESQDIRARLSKYLQPQGSTNKIANQARLLLIDGVQIDCFRDCFDKKIVVVVPHKSSNGVLTQRLQRQTIETLTNLCFGLTRGIAKPWGLQKRFIDDLTFARKIDSSVAIAIAWRVYEDHRSVDSAGIVSIRRRTPNSNSTYWNGVLDHLKSIGGTLAANYTVGSVQAIISGNAHGYGLLQAMPVFPQSFWGNKANTIPRNHLKAIDPDTGEIRLDKEAREDRKRGIMMSKTTRTRPPQTAKSRKPLQAIPASASAQSQAPRLRKDGRVDRRASQFRATNRPAKNVFFDT